MSDDPVSRQTATAPSSSPITLRGHRPGDMGWVVQAHGETYVRDLGWDHLFEALIAEVVAGFLRGFDPLREHCWIAERDGLQVGCIFLVRQSDEVAKLRMLLVDPSTRGTGLGRLLVRECIRFAREAGYQRLDLWTINQLEAARHLYESEGFHLVAETPNETYGPGQVDETWTLTL